MAGTDDRNTLGLQQVRLALVRTRLHGEDALTAALARATNDARTDPETRELRPYLERHGIRSMLDAPVFRNGDIVGVVCHEHVGEPRRWSESEQLFACSVADVVAYFSEAAALLRSQRAQHEAEVAAMRSERHDSLRVFAGGVAHDINNAPMAASLSVLQLQRSMKGPMEQEAVAAITDTIRHVAGLARELQGFAAPVPVPTHAVDLAAFLRDLAPGLRALATPDVEVVIGIPEVEVVVRIDRDALRRVLLNLVRNATDAMTRGGQLLVAVDCSADRVTVSVRDDGVGMTEEVKRQMFDPFFATKSGGGRGLGLSSVAAIVQRAGGTIEVDSEVGQGTTVRLRLPRVLHA